MAVSAAVYVDRKFRAREKVCPAIAEGINRAGDVAKWIPTERYPGHPEADVAIFYGYGQPLRRIKSDYLAAGKKAVHIDLGYWQRRFNGDRYGYHRFAINDRHPTAYFQRVKHPQDRADAVGVSLKPWRHKRGEPILLCGMSEKAAGVGGLGFEEWERQAVTKIKTVTDRPIWYRPKPNKQGSYRQIEGTILSPSRRLGDFQEALSNSWCVVSHHSNAGLDAIVQGIPCFQVDGIALPMGLADLSLIETPKAPTEEDRRQWVNDVAYTQFNRDEMRNSVAWRHLKNEGLIP